MKVLVSQLQCPICKMPIKSPLVERCPKCNARLTTDIVSKRTSFLIISTLVSCIFAGIIVYYRKRDDTDISIIIFSTIFVFFLIISMIGLINYKNKKKLRKDEQYIGSNPIMKLEEVPIFADINFNNEEKQNIESNSDLKNEAFPVKLKINFNKKYLYAPIFFVICIFILILLFDNDFVPSDYYIVLSIIFVIGFSISIFYAVIKYFKKFDQLFDAK